MLSLLFFFLFDDAEVALVLVIGVLALLPAGLAFATGAFFVLATDLEKKEKRLPCFSDLAFFAGGAMTNVSVLSLYLEPLADS